MHSHSDLFLAAEFVKQIDRVDFLGHIADQKIDIVLRDLKATVTEKARKGYHIAAVQNPLPRKGMAISVNAGRFHAAPLVVFIKHVVACALDQLFAIRIAKQKILFAFGLAIFQKLCQYVRHGLIDRNEKRFAVFCDVDVNYAVVKINILASQFIFS